MLPVSPLLGMVLTASAVDAFAVSASPCCVSRSHGFSGWDRVGRGLAGFLPSLSPGRSLYFPEQAAVCRSLPSLRLSGEKGGDDNPAHLDPKFEGWVDRSWKKAEQLEQTFALQANVFSTDLAVLRNKEGETIHPEDFAPFLKRFYEETKSMVEIVFVSSDFSEEEALETYHQNHGDWLMLDYNSPLREEYKLRYGVWSGRETAQLATSIAAFKGRKSGVPALVVLSLDGEPTALLDAEARGLACLIEWQIEDQKWAPMPRSSSSS